MNIFELLSSVWVLDISLLILCGLILSGYFTLYRNKLSNRSIFFLIGFVLLVFALLSPLNNLSKTYLFSANMFQHMLLLLVIPLFFIFSISESTVRRLMKRNGFDKTISILCNPVIAWFLGVGSMWIWHLPSIHEAAINNEIIRYFQIISFLLFGLIFWWPVFSPIKQKRLNPLLSTLYLASACLGCTVLGILITFAQTGIYAIYLNPAESMGIVSYLRNDLCLSPKVDQQIGGLTMWIPGCVLYLIASMITLANWYRTPDNDTPLLVNSKNNLLANNFLQN